MSSVRSYEARLREEIDHYTGLYTRSEPSRETLMEPAPPIWIEIQNRSAALIQEATGADIVGHMLRRLQPGSRMLSLGSGPGGVEMVLAREAPRAEYLCIDVNADLLAMGRNSAAAEGLPVRFEQADLNHVELPRAEFDLVFCHAALHHVLELERLANQIRGALKPGGELAVVDIISRNGYRMWPETRKLVRSLWATLPPRYRVNHTRRGCPVDARIWEADTRRTGMECARSEEILPVLRRHFQQKLFVGYQAFCRRFFNTMYGPNYDVGRALDRAIVDWIWELDCECVRSQDLKPESFFGIFGEHAQAQSQ